MTQGGSENLTVDTDVIVEDDRWAAAGLDGLAESAVRTTCMHLGLTGDWEISVLGCDDARIAVLNAEFRGKPAPTNVLSWPSAERGAAVAGQRPAMPEAGDDPELGDIAIAFETTTREASEGGVSLTDHILHLIVHATLHLLGYDHVRDADGDLMEATEVAILADLGVADPYDRTAPD